MKHVLQMLIFGAMLCVPWVTQAQTLADYTLAVDTVTFTSIASTGTAISFTEVDDGYGIVTLPFAMPFGESFLSSGASIAVSANGFLYLGRTTTSGTTATYVSSSCRSVNALMGSNAHMGRNTGAGAYYYYNAADSTLTIEYHGLGHYYSPYGFYSYQYVLHQNGDIDFVYDSVNLGGGSPTLRAFLWDGPNSDLVSLSGAWANPTLGTTIGTMSTTTLPAHGLRIRFHCPAVTCPRPLNFTSIATTASDSLYLSWTEGGTATNYLVAYNTIPLTNPASAINLLSVNDTMVGLDGLTANTLYYCYVAAVCGSGDTSRWVYGAFRTACDIITTDDLPWVDNFDGLASGSATEVPCWHKGTTNTSTAYPCPSTIAYSGSRSLYFYSYSTSHYCWAVMPAIATELDSLMISFQMRGSTHSDSYYQSSVELGIVTDPDDISTFHSLTTISVPSGGQWYLREYYFNNVPDTLSGYIAFRVAANATQYYNFVCLDDVTIDLIPACAHITDLAVVGTTPVAAMLTWTRSISDANAEAVIEYRADSISTWTYAGTATGESYALTGLAPSTTYWARVAALCNGIDSSYFDSISFVTTAYSCAVVDTTASDTAVVGTRSSQASGVPVVYNYGNTLWQGIYTASELTSAGLSAGPITDLTFTWTNNSSYAKEFTIWLSTTSDSTYTGITYKNVSNAVMVYTGGSPDRHLRQRHLPSDYTVQLGW